MEDDRRRHRTMEAVLLLVIVIFVLCMTLAVLAATTIDWHGMGVMLAKSVRASCEALPEASVALSVTLAFGASSVLLVRVIAESAYVVALMPREASHAIALVGTAAVASALLATTTSYFLLWASARASLVTGCAVASAIVLCAFGRRVDLLSLSMDATRNGLVPTTTYGSPRDVVVPYGVIPAYRKARREARLMQSIGIGADACLVIGNAGELSMVADSLPSDSPLAMFLTGTGPNVFDDDRRFPFGVGRLVDTARNYFVTFDEKQLARRDSDTLMTADDFVRVRKGLSGMLTESVVVRGTTIGGSVARSGKGADVSDTPCDKDVLAMQVRDAIGNMLIDIDDGTVGDGTISAVVPPDKSGIIPITDDSVVPIIQSESEDETLVDVGIGDIVNGTDE